MIFRRRSGPGSLEHFLSGGNQRPAARSGADAPPPGARGQILLDPRTGDVRPGNPSAVTQRESHPTAAATVGSALGARRQRQPFSQPDWGSRGVGVSFPVPRLKVGRGTCEQDDHTFSMRVSGEMHHQRSIFCLPVFPVARRNCNPYRTTRRNCNTNRPP